MNDSQVKRDDTVIVDGQRCLVTDVSIGGDQVRVSRFGDLSGEWVGRWVSLDKLEAPCSICGKVKPLSHVTPADPPFFPVDGGFHCDACEQWLQHGTVAS